MRNSLLTCPFEVFGQVRRLIVCPKALVPEVSGTYDAILVTNPGEEPPQIPVGATRCLQLFFDDIEEGERAAWGGRRLVPMAKAQAKEVADFVCSEETAQTLVVACDGGVSRSAGIGAGILAAMRADDSAIFAQKCPNATCRRLVVEAVADALWQKRVFTAESQGVLAVSEEEFVWLEGLTESEGRD